MNNKRLIQYDQNLKSYEITAIGLKLRTRISSLFKSNLDSILVYGSALIYTEFTDQDVLVILKNKINIKEDLKNLKEVLDNLTNIKLDLQLQYGTGMGMFVIRNLVKLLNAELSIQSEEGIGTTTEVVFKK